MRLPLTLQCNITAQEHGQPLLALLTERFAYHNVEQWRQIVASGLVLLNGATARDEQPVSCGDTLTYNAVNHQEPPVPLEVEIIRETPELLVVGKPAGVPVSRAGLIIHNTFVNILRRRYKQDIHLLHRLDRETSGLLLCARSKEYCSRFQKELNKTITGKYYLAIITGRLGQPDITVEQPLAAREDSRIRCQMWNDANGKPCRTRFHEIACNENHSLLLAELLTGRKHQIRAHLRHLGLPLVGDKIYSHEGKYFLKRLHGELTENDYRELGAHNHVLHAWAARLKLAEQPEALYFSRIFSADMERYLKCFPDWEKKALAVLQHQGSEDTGCNCR